ncbi:MAG: DUF3047 domain-containing protein [Pseudomonadota bacterium]
MNRGLGIIWAVWMVLMLSIAAVHAQESVALREDFNNLDNWKPLNFPKIERHSEYAITLDNAGKRILTTRSNASASGIIFKGSFNPYHHPILRWRWKVDNVYSKADPHTKQGDDYPLRVYVIFEYDPAKAGLAQRAKYGLAKQLYGEYPPLASLSYVWAGRNIAEPFFDNPYTDRAKMIPLRSGTGQLGQWVEEEVNILADYRRVFGEDPPASASLAIMNDSDNTGEAAVSHLAFIELRSSTPAAETSTRNP